MATATPPPPADAAPATTSRTPTKWGDVGPGKWLSWINPRKPLSSADTDETRVASDASLATTNPDGYLAQDLRYGSLIKSVNRWFKGDPSVSRTLVTHSAWGLLPPSNRDDFEAYIARMSALDLLAFGAIYFHARESTIHRYKHEHGVIHKFRLRSHLAVEMTAPWLHPDLYADELEARDYICKALQANESLPSEIQEWCFDVQRDDVMRDRAIACKLFQIVVDPDTGWREPFFDPDVAISAQTVIAWPQAVKIGYLWAIAHASVLDCGLQTCFVNAALAVIARGKASGTWITTRVKAMIEAGLALDAEASETLNAIFPVYLSRVGTGFHWEDGFKYFQSIGDHVGGARLTDALFRAKWEAVVTPTLVSVAVTEFPEFYWPHVFKLIGAKQFNAASGALDAALQNIERGLGMMDDNAKKYKGLAYVCEKLMTGASKKEVACVPYARTASSKFAARLDTLVELYADQPVLTKRDSDRLAEMKAGAAMLYFARCPGIKAPCLIAKAVTEFPNFYWARVHGIVGADQFSAASKHIRTAIDKLELVNGTGYFDAAKYTDLTFVSYVLVAELAGEKRSFKCVGKTVPVRDSRELIELVKRYKARKRKRTEKPPLTGEDLATLTDFVAKAAPLSDKKFPIMVQTGPLKWLRGTSDTSRTTSDSGFRSVSQIYQPAHSDTTSDSDSDTTSDSDSDTTEYSSDSDSDSSVSRVSDSDSSRTSSDSDSESDTAIYRPAGSTRAVAPRKLYPPWMKTRPWIDTRPPHLSVLPDKSRPKMPCYMIAHPDEYLAQKVRLDSTISSLGEWFEGGLITTRTLVTHPAWGLMPPSSLADWDAYVEDMSWVDPLTFGAICYHARVTALRRCELEGADETMLTGEGLTGRELCKLVTLGTVEIAAPWLHPDLYADEEESRDYICEALQRTESLPTDIQDWCATIHKDDAMKERAMACKLLQVVGGPDALGQDSVVFDPDVAAITAETAITWPRAVKIGYLWAIVAGSDATQHCFFSTALASSSRGEPTERTKEWLKSRVLALIEKGLPVFLKAFKAFHAIYPVFLKQVKRGFHEGHVFKYLESVGRSVGGDRLGAAVAHAKYERLSAPCLVARAVTMFPDFYWRYLFLVLEQNQYDAASKAVAEAIPEPYRGFGERYGGDTEKYDGLVYVSDRLMTEVGGEPGAAGCRDYGENVQRCASRLNELVDRYRKVREFAALRAAEKKWFPEEDLTGLSEMKARARTVVEKTWKMPLSAATCLAAATAVTMFPNFCWRRVRELIGAEQFDAVSKSFADIAAGRIIRRADVAGYADLVFVSRQLMTELAGEKADAEPRLEPVYSTLAALVDAYKDSLIDAMFEADRTELTEQASGELLAIYKKASRLVELDGNERYAYSRMGPPYVVARAVTLFSSFDWKRVYKLIGAEQFERATVYMACAYGDLECRLGNFGLESYKYYHDLVFVSNMLVTEVGREATPWGFDHRHCVGDGKFAAELRRMVDAFRGKLRGKPEAREST